MITTRTGTPGNPSGAAGGWSAVTLIQGATPKLPCCHLPVQVGGPEGRGVTGVSFRDGEGDPGSHSLPRGDVERPVEPLRASLHARDALAFAFHRRIKTNA